MNPCRSSQQFVNAMFFNSNFVTSADKKGAVPPLFVIYISLSFSKEDLPGLLFGLILLPAKMLFEVLSGIGLVLQK